MFNRAGMLTADGRCKTLDASADGYVRGEAVVSLTLQLVSSASASGLAALCYLTGSAVNQDGRSSTLTAPNGPAQQATIRQALVSGGRAAADVAAVQLHGTGTPLGDPIEVGALAAVLIKNIRHASRTAGPQPLALMAGKTSMGHTEPAAGLVGVAHACQAMSAAVLQPILHLQKVREWLGCRMDGRSRFFATRKIMCMEFPAPAAQHIHGGQREQRRVFHVPSAGRARLRNCTFAGSRPGRHQLLCFPGHQRACAHQPC